MGFVIPRWLLKTYLFTVNSHRVSSNLTRGNDFNPLDKSPGIILCTINFLLSSPPPTVSDVNQCNSLQFILQNFVKIPLQGLEEWKVLKQSEWEVTLFWPELKRYAELNFAMGNDGPEMLKWTRDRCGTLSEETREVIN